MSRHDGVSCDSCLKSNFKGKRYKCLICFDYDLCSTCYEAKCVTSRHSTDHPMQCILTRNDYELYYGGENAAAGSTQSYTCPYCGKMGYTDTSLIEHVSLQHSQSPYEVLCPICAAGTSTRPNVVRDNLLGHLHQQHQNAQRDLLSIFDDPNPRHVRRLPLPATRSMASRGRRANVHFTTTNTGYSGGITPINPTRDTTNPIAEFLTHLSVVRRSHTSPPLTAERQHIRASRHIDKNKKNPTPANPRVEPTKNGSNLQIVQSAVTLHPSQLLLPKLLKESLSEEKLEAGDEERLGKSLYLKQLLMSSLKTSK